MGNQVRLGDAILPVARVATASILAIMLIVVCAAPASHAARRTAPRDVTLADLPGMILDPWRETQLASGDYRRPSGSTVRDAMGTSSLAYATLMKAKRSGSDADFKSSMLAFESMVSGRARTNGVFSRFYLASAFNLASRHFGERPEFRAIRRDWADRLRRIRYGDQSFRTGYRYNKNVIEAAEVLELLRTGLHSRYRGSVLHDRGTARRRAIAVIRRQIPSRVAELSVTIGPEQGWPRAVTVADVSDIPDNPPAYNALVASFYVRAVGLLPVASRTPAMRHAARTLARAIAARMPPDGDLSFTGRTQELSWSLTSTMHAAWWAAKISAAPERPVLLELARRALDRIKRSHVYEGVFLLTPAQRCCLREDLPKGHDVYFDVSNYSGLTAVELEWALEEQPGDWAEGDGKLPADRESTYLYPHGRGRFLQHRGPGLYWMVRGQGNSADARLDMGVTVMKGRRSDGTWADIVPPHPLTGGHHLRADPAGPCLRAGPDGRSCAYLQLHRPVRLDAGYQFAAQWRTRRRTLVHSGLAWVRPTPKGLVLSWTTQPGQLFQVDHFLESARCIEKGVAAPGLLVTMSTQASCRIVARGYAGGTQSDLDRVRSMIAGDGFTAMFEYQSTVD